VAAAIANIILMYFVASQLFRDQRLGAAAAAILAASPVHFHQARIATSQIGLVTFTLLWLLFVIRYLDQRRRVDLIAASSLAGLGTYVYLPAVFMMPLQFALGLAASVVEPRTAATAVRRDLLIAIGTFAAMLLPAALWHGTHPERLQQLSSYYTGNGYNVGDAAVFSLRGAVVRGDYWWNTFNPGALFFSGDANVRFSTRQVGHFLLPVAPLLLVGVLWGLQSVSRAERILLAGGLIAAPLPAMLTGGHDIKRSLTIVPFVVLTAAVGLRVLIAWSGRAWAVLALLTAVCAVQFTAYLRDYHGEYRVRSVPWFGGNMRGAVAEVSAHTNDARCVLIDRRLYSDYWGLYTTVNGRGNLASQTNVIDVADRTFGPVSACAATELIVSAEVVRDNPTARANLEKPGWTARAVPEPHGEVHLLVYRYVPEP
jgi:4-amino-4-deoxy-L-arabinose transferase-like glycosyltransferase